jgi:Leucine-rich repeat (LRR) protein
LYNNQITEIKGLDQLIHLQVLSLSNNQITEIKGLDQLIRLQVLYLYNNQITEIKGLDQLIHLQELYLYNNQITEIPLTILHNINLTHINHDDHVIINDIIGRFVNRNKIKTQKLHIYNDSQNVHDSTINKSISKSIYTIMNNSCNISFDEILNDAILTEQTKQQLIEYCNLNDVHSTLNVTFKEVFNSVFHIIKHHQYANEIKSILNEEMQNSLCKCFTGRLSRLVNCLNGFDDRVNINISSNDEIANIIVMILNKYPNESIEIKQNICTKELSERGYDQNTINEWILYIVE